MPASIGRRLKDQHKLPDEVVVWLGYYREGIRNFNCVHCKKTQFKYQQSLIALLPYGEAERVVQSPPLSIQCSVCGTIYHVQGVM